MAWWLQRWDTLRGSLWFIPGLGVLGALLLSVMTLQIDYQLSYEELSPPNWLITTSSAARLTLSSLAGALITVTGVVFSMTMLTLAQTSSQYGPRLLRSFLNQNVTQLTLAVFVGTSLYCMSVLRTIREIGEGDLFVPHLSVFVGLCLGLMSLLFFVYFIHYTASSIQAESVIRAVSYELDDAIERLFPKCLGDDSDDSNADSSNSGDSDPSPEKPDSTILIQADSIGYIQGIDGDRLIELADQLDTVFYVRAKPGDYIFHGAPLLDVAEDEVEEEFQSKVRETFLTGVRRTPRQDTGCVIKELVEVAIRALSPGINDPHTAVACINSLASALSSVAGREFPDSHRRNEEGKVRVIVQTPTFSQLLDDCFREIRFYGADSFLVLEQLSKSLLMLSYFVQRKADAQAICRHLKIIESLAEKNLTVDEEKKQILAITEEGKNRLEKIV
ncbi:DUF2254 domain-containing protein [Thalassoglobus polymorphus]|uniref:DUF2254 domain-containing protein n=1 Tax=Thalassoglobus polymorphus TaxID=2527994 RepID=A0A517QVA0_9PLAN|nr:DUF2254 domain-containing protein [Thalassoglobus polymorphus]QDT35521.1 hypothetical protein Mal48_47980 [Thalassoglobus polymorphus]